MKSLIVLAIAVHLVSVQGSRIIQQDLDYEQLNDYGRDYIRADRRDAITSWENLDEIRGMGMIQNAHPEKRRNDVKCEVSTCKVCLYSLCLRLTHLPGETQLYLQFDFRVKNLLDKNIDVKYYHECKEVKFGGIRLNSCVTLSDVRVVDSKVCTTATITTSVVSKSFEDICM